MPARAVGAAATVVVGLTISSVRDGAAWRHNVVLHTAGVSHMWRNCIDWWCWEIDVTPCVHAVRARWCAVVDPCQNGDLWRPRLAM